MPLEIDGFGPIAGTIAPGVPLADRVRAIPALQGAWYAQDVPDGLVPSWPAREGTLTLTQATALRQLTKGEQGGVGALVGTQGSMAVNPVSFANEGAVAFAARFYFGAANVDLQYLFSFFGGAAVTSGVYRSGSQTFIIDTGTPANNISLPLTVGWHDLIYTQEAGTTTTPAQSTLNIDGNIVTGMSAGIGATKFVLFNRNEAANTQSIQGAISRALLARSAPAIGSEHYQTIQAMLRS